MAAAMAPRPRPPPPRPPPAGRPPLQTASAAAGACASAAAAQWTSARRATSWASAPTPVPSACDWRPCWASHTAARARSSPGLRKARTGACSWRVVGENSEGLAWKRHVYSRVGLQYMYCHTAAKRSQVSEGCVYSTWRPLRESRARVLRHVRRWAAAGRVWALLQARSSCSSFTQSHSQLQNQSAACPTWRTLRSITRTASGV